MASAVDVHRAAHDAFNRRDWDGMRQFVAADIAYVDQARGMTVRSVDDFLAYLHEWAGGMSDARVDEPRYLDAGTHSIARFRGRGINDGQLGPANATGKPLDLAFCEILSVEGDRITGGEIYYDAMTMMAQFGVIEAPAAA